MDPGLCKKTRLSREWRVRANQGDFSWISQNVITNHSVWLTNSQPPLTSPIRRQRNVRTLTCAEKQLAWVEHQHHHLVEATGEIGLPFCLAVHMEETACYPSHYVCSWFNGGNHGSQIWPHTGWEILVPRPGVNPGQKSGSQTGGKQDRATGKSQILMSTCSSGHFRDLRAARTDPHWESGLTGPPSTPPQALFTSEEKGTWGCPPARHQLHLLRWSNTSSAWDGLVPAQSLHCKAVGNLGHSSFAWREHPTFPYQMQCEGSVHPYLMDGGGVYKHSAKHRAVVNQQSASDGRSNKTLPTSH